MEQCTERIDEGQVISFDKHSDRYFKRVLPVVINNQTREYVYICKKDESGFPKISVYSDYFFDKVLKKSLLNTAVNTKQNFHARFVVRFLNYIFIDSKNRISNIEDLTKDLIKEFLERHSTGTLGTERIKGWKAKDTAEDAGTVVTRFVYWLYSTKRNYKKIFKLKYIKESDFSKETVTITNKRTGNKTQEERLIIMEEYQINNTRKTREKVTTATLYMVKALIEVARKNDPMMELGIILGAFVGMRQGDVTQMHRGRIATFEPSDILEGCTIDLQGDNMLRSDGKNTGNIKIKRKQPIYEAFLTIINDAYKEHLNLLEEKGLDGNIYGALMIDENGNAMTKETYNKRFNKLTEVLLRTLEDSALRGNEYAVRDYDILQQVKLTHHSLRHYYTQTLEKYEKNLMVVQYYRGDSNINSQKPYKGNMSTIEGIKSIQDAMLEELRKMGYERNGH